MKKKKNPFKNQKAQNQLNMKISTLAERLEQSLEGTKGETYLTEWVKGSIKNTENEKQQFEGILHLAAEMPYHAGIELAIFYIAKKRFQEPGLEEFRCKLYNTPLSEFLTFIRELAHQ